MNKCYYYRDKEIGKVLIPNCMPVVHSDDITDCICGGELDDITFSQFERQLYNDMRDKFKEILNGKNAYIKELEEEIIRLNS